MPSCFVKGCAHRTGQKARHPNVTLHPFPKNIETIKNWLQQTGEHFDDFDKLAQRVLEGKKNDLYRMCSCHFTDDSYMMRGNRHVLKPSAVPTRFPSTSIQQPLHIVSAIPPPKRPRIEIETRKTSKPETCIPSQVVRIVSRLRTVYTQTDLYAPRHDKYCNTEHWINQRIASTQTVDSKISLASGTQIYNSGADVHPRSCALSTLQTKPVVRNSREPQGTIFRKCSSKAFSPSPMGNKSSRPSDVGNTWSEGYFNDPMDIPCEPYELPSIQSLESSTENKDHVTERKFIIYESCLNQLLHLIRCQHPVADPCYAPVKSIKKTVSGSMLKVQLTCQKEHYSYFWHSQPMENSTSVGNVQLAASILYSGSNFKKVSEMFSIFGVQSISQAAYYNYQRNFLFPAIRREWRNELKDIEKDITGKPIVVAGESQFDCRGLSAKFCTFTLMDAMTKKIVNYSIDQLSPGKSSAGLEKSTFETCLKGLLERGAEVKMVATNRPVSIRKLMSAKYAHICHKFNMWHICKNLRKKLLVASRLSGCSVLAVWIRPIIKHLWFSAKTCKQNADLLIAKWRSLLYHIRDQHRFPEHKMYHKCEHDRISKWRKEDKMWLKETDKAFQQLSKIVNAPQLLNDLRQTHMFCHTGGLEIYHRKMAKFRPKRLSCGIESMHARTIMAALSHNRNLNQKRVVTQCPKIACMEIDKSRFKIAFAKQTNRWITKPVYENVKDCHVIDIMRNTLQILSRGLKLRGRH